MTRVDADNLGFHGTWVDGYLPGLPGMKELAGKYRHLDIEDNGTPGPYGFSQAGDKWTREDFFGAIGSALRARFDHAELPDDERPAPCFLWLARFDKPATDVIVQPLYEETLADPRREDYCALIAIREACSVEGGCLQNVLRRVCFEPKADAAYADLARFSQAAGALLNRYLDIVAAPWLEVERLLGSVASSITSAGP